MIDKDGMGDGISYHALALNLMADIYIRSKSILALVFMLTTRMQEHELLMV